MTPWLIIQWCFAILMLLGTLVVLAMVLGTLAAFLFTSNDKPKKGKS